MHNRATNKDSGEDGKRSRMDRMDSIVLGLPPSEIVRFKAIIESYDNLATLRTEDPRRHHLRLYFSPECAEEVEALLASLAGTFSIRRLAE
jgi:Domain of unknown function (DUF4911)